MKRLINIFSIVLVAIALLAATTRSAEATFNVCNVFPWLPQCQPDPTPSPSPTPTPDPTPDATPSAVPLTQGAEGCSQDCSPSYNPPVCNGVPAEKPVFTGLSRVSPTEVKVSWYGTNTEYYSLIYGYYGGEMIYGIPHINGDSFEVNIGQLEPNRAVNVQLFAYRNNCSTASETVDP